MTKWLLTTGLNSRETHVRFLRRQIPTTITRWIRINRCGQLGGEYALKAPRENEYFSRPSGGTQQDLHAAAKSIMRFKKFFAHIKPLLLVGAVVFFLALNSHDDGIPDTLTAEQQQHVIDTCNDWNYQMERVIAGIEDFGARPDDEAICARALVLEIESLIRIGDKFYTEPEFYADIELAPELTEKMWKLAKTDLTNATDDLIKELLRRRDDPDFEVDQASYDTVIVAMKSMNDVEKVKRSFCVPGECFWCALRQRRGGRKTSSPKFTKWFCETVGVE